VTGARMIALERVSVALGGRRVVDGLDLAVAAGSWTMLIGPNGAGKTTVLRAIAGLIAHLGSIAVAGREPRALSVRARARNVALVPQSPLLPLAMTVSEYVRLGRTAHLGMLGRAGARDRAAVAEAIARLGLEPLVARPLGALSGGEQQRAVLARAVAQAAPVLLLDEPTSALDIGRQQDVLELVGELRAERGLTVLGAMHDLTLAGQYADRLALLDAGRLVGLGAPSDVLTEELIGRHYRARVRVTAMAGAPVVVPTRGPGS
jgi:iron complex transport system ATP-binding protein